MGTVRLVNIALESFGGLLCLILMICLVASERRKSRPDRLFIRVLVCNTLTLFSDAAAWALKGGSGVFTWWGVRIANFLVFACGYLLLAAFTDYLVGYVSTRDPSQTKTPATVMRLLSAVAILLVVISQFNHMFYLVDSANYYHRQSGFWLSQTFGIFCMLINGGILFRCRKKLERSEFLVMGICIALPVVSMAIQIVCYGVVLLNIATTVSALGIYLGIQVEQARIISEKELELERTRVAIMRSQIQPHFIFNALEAIGELYHTNPTRAERAVTDFSLFLRGNLDALTSTETIPFEQEAAHTSHYLDLEQLRYGSRLRVVWDVTVSYFQMPSLTLQPVVENAVRHGVAKKPGGGTITIRTLEMETDFLIMVSDDGVGFDSGQPVREGGIGIGNVRARLAAQCGGSLEISSKAGQGTVAVITIPK